MTPDELRERLAAIEHERWADWQRYMHSLMKEVRYPDWPSSRPLRAYRLSSDLYDRWERQIATPYADLSEAEKASDMEQVDRYWHLIEPLLLEKTP